MLKKTERKNNYILKNDKNGKFYVEFIDGMNVYRVIEVDKKIYEVMKEFELNEKSQKNKIDRHITKFEYTDEELYKKAFDKSLHIDELIEKNILIEELKNAINQLSEIQKRRIMKYYFENFTIEQIAKSESTTHQAISKSLKKSLKLLEKLIKNKKNSF